jgi:uncharacterized membrane protein YebE (DUF533 family)
MQTAFVADAGGALRAVVAGGKDALARRIGGRDIAAAGAVALGEVGDRRTASEYRDAAAVIDSELHRGRWKVAVTAVNGHQPAIVGESHEGPLLAVLFDDAADGILVRVAISRI